jgi:tetratricopeptide (TPR) repeat protein/sporulation protein YlmC with PRC-barrel domain
MSSNQNKFQYRDLFKYQVFDNKGQLVGQITDIVLSTTDLSISKLIVSQDLFDYECSIMKLEDIFQENTDKRHFTLSCERMDVQNASIQDFWDIAEDKEEILFSRLKNLPIIDVDYQEHESKVIDLVTRGLDEKNPRVLLLERGFIFSNDFIRYVSDKEIMLTISNTNIENIRYLDEEKYDNFFIDPEREIETLDIHKPDWFVVNKLIILGHTELVERLLKNWQISKIFPEEAKYQLCYHLGKAYLELGEVNEAFPLFKTIKLFTDQNIVDQLLLGRAYTQLGRCFIKVGDLDEAQTTLEKAIGILSDLKYSVYRVIAINWIGRIFWLRGMLKEALNTFEQSLWLAKAFHSPKAIAITLENLGIIYREEGQLEKANELFQEGIKILKNGYPRTLSSIMKNQAIAYYERAMSGKALEIHFDALIIREKIGNAIDIADSVFNFTRLEVTMGSLNHSSSILTHFPSGPYKRPLLKAYRSIIDGLLEIIAKNWDQAIINFKNALSPYLDFNYQVWVYEYLSYSLLMKWKENPDEEVLSVLTDRLSKACALTKKNNLISYTCKITIILALLSLYSKEFEKAKSYFREALELAEAHNLKTHKTISQRGLETLPTIIETFSQDKTLNSSDYDQTHFLEEKIKMEIVLYARYLRTVHMF